MKTKFSVLAVVALLAYGLKRHYADASTDALSWILTPTAHLVALVTGVTFAAVPGEGYFSAERMFLIEKACAGVNFMIAAFAMVAIMLLHRVQPPGPTSRTRPSLRPAMVVGVSLLASYLAAVVVNSVRIVIALWLAAHPPAVSSLSASDIHRLEGIVVYFGGLLLLYSVVQRIDRGAPVFRYALPLGCYYLVALGLPLAHGAAQASDAFLAHAVAVLAVPLILLLFIFGVRALLAGYPRRSVSAGSSPQARHAGSQAAAAAAASSAPAPTR